MEILRRLIIKASCRQPVHEIPPPMTRPSPGPVSVVDKFRGNPDFAGLLAAAGAGGGPIHFPQIAPSAQAFVAAALAASHPARRLWVVCQDLRQQERVVSELETWGLQPLFLPEEEALPVDTAAGDPEIAAERLHVLSTIAAADLPHPVVLTAASLAEKIPPPCSLPPPVAGPDRGHGPAHGHPGRTARGGRL